MTKYLFMVATLLVSSLSEVSGGAVVLTTDDFKEKIQGKNAFIMFMFPWGIGWKQMTPHWDELADLYASSSSVLIAKVNCNAPESKALCEDYGVDHYPYLKYFLNGDEKDKDYEGRRNLDSLKAFAKENLEIKCDPGKPSECSEKEEGYIKKMNDMTSEFRKKPI